MTALPPLRYLCRRDIESLGLTAADLVAPIRAALTDKSSAGGTESPPKVGVHPRQSAALHAAAGYLASTDQAGIKWISRYPENPAGGMGVCAGLCIINDAGTGLPLAVLDASWITETRTAAATAVALLAARPLGVPEVALVGFGTQGLAHLRALPDIVPGLQRVRILARHPDQARQRLAAERPDVEVLVAHSAEQALRDVPAAVSALPMRQPAAPEYDAGMLAPESVVVAIDFDAAWLRSIFGPTTVFAVDDVAQYRQFRTQGWFGHYPDNPLDIGDVLAGIESLPSSGRVYVNMMGIGLEDVAAAATVLDQASRAGVGQLLDR